MDNLLSIIIPTYNRYQYLMDSIDAITETISSDQIEIVVQDNTEDNSVFGEYLKNKKDARIKYFHEATRLTVSENCSKGIQNSCGKYICLIGDDDAICSAVVDLVKCMDKNGIDACNFEPALYHWPDLVQQMSSLEAMTALSPEDSLIYFDSEEILDQEIKRGLQKLYDFPRAYHEIISRKVLNMVYDKVGTFFPGPSPDMANAVLCCIYAKKCIKIGIPMMVSGYSAASTGGLSRQRRHKGNLKGKDWLPKDVEEKWHKKIPLLWLPCTIWPASAIEALERANETDRLKKMNYGIVYGETLLQSRFEGLKSVLRCKVTLGELCFMVKHMVARIIGRVKRKEQKDVIVNNNVVSLKEALDFQNTLNSKINIEHLFDCFPSK